MSRFLDRRLSGLIPYTPGEQPRRMGRIIKLNTNENPYPPGPKVRDMLTPETAAELALYPDPECRELRKTAATVYGLVPEQIIAGNGSDELLAFCFQAFGGRGVTLPDLSYGFYPVCAALYGVTAESVPLKEDFSLAVRDYVGKAGAVIIANPNAPTGLVLPLADMRSLLEQDRDRLVIVDEAYADFGPVTALPLLRDYDNLLIVRTLSKAYSLAGARLGLAFGAPALIADLNRIRYSFNPYNVNRLTQAVGGAALLDQEYFALCRDRLINCRERLRRGLLELGFHVPESSANFLLAGAHPRVAGAEYARQLRQRSILVRYFPVPRVADYVRISVGSEEEISELLRATEQILKEV